MSFWILSISLLLAGSNGGLCANAIHQETTAPGSSQVLQDNADSESRGTAPEVLDSRKTQPDQHGNSGMIELEKRRGRRHAFLKALTIGSASISLVATMSAYRYMSLADRAYERYLRTGNPRDMNRYFRRSEIYDRRAGYALFLFEVSFVTAISSFFLSLGR